MLAALAMAGAASVPGGLASATIGLQRVTVASTDATKAMAAYAQAAGSHRTSSGEFASGAWLRLRATRQRRAGFGWTNAHQKRVARKARNIRRHRAAQKG